MPSIPLEIDIEQELRFDSDTGLVLDILLTHPSNDLPFKNTMEFSSLVDAAEETGRLELDYADLYCIAHELTRYGEQLRGVAQAMEEGRLLEERYEIEYPGDVL